MRGKISKLTVCVILDMTFQFTLSSHNNNPWGCMKKLVKGCCPSVCLTKMFSVSRWYFYPLVM